MKIKPIWIEDDTTLRDPDAEHFRDAYRRLFGEDAPGQGILIADWGDASAYLLPRCLHIGACDGSSFYRLEDAYAILEKNLPHPTFPQPTTT